MDLLNGIQNDCPDGIQKDSLEVSKKGFHKIPKNDFYDVYVAYSEIDIDFVIKLSSQIEEQGLRCYIKDRDELCGYMLENLLIESQNSHLVLIIYTEHSLKDRLIKFLIIQSIHYTLNFGKLHLTFLLHNIDKKDLPKQLSFVPHVFTSEKNYFDKLIKKLRAPKISMDHLLPVGNVSSGLVWSFYYGYLQIILPEIPTRINEWVNNNPSKSEYIPRRIYILLPTHGYCYDSLCEVDTNIEFVQTFTTRKINQAGNVNRNYTNTIYKISNDDKDYYFVGEYATPVKTMHEMERGQIAGLTTSDLFKQVHYFEEKLSEVLEHKDCAFKCCTLVICKDEDSLSEILLKAIQKDLKKT